MADEVFPGDVVSLVGPVEDPLVPLDQPIAIAYEDGDLIVCDKPAGMHVHPVGPYRRDTLVNALLWHAGARPGHPWAAWRPYPAHRLDRAARGLVAVAKRSAVHDAIRGAVRAQDDHSAVPRARRGHRGRRCRHYRRTTRS